MQHNTFFFERAELKEMPNSGIKINKFKAKKMNHTVIDLEIDVTVNGTYRSPFLHFLAYRQFSSNEYRKFLFDMWEDFRKVAGGGDGNVMLKIIKRMVEGNNNVFRECPYTPGNYFIRLKRWPIDTLNFGQLLPSGRYRFELLVANRFKGDILIIYKLYVNISDQRIEQF